jgi:hypothetical protein
MSIIKTTQTILSIFIAILMALPCSASMPTTSAEATAHNATPIDFDEIAVIGHGPIGIELVRTVEDEITCEFLNVEHEDRYTVTQAFEDGKAKVEITNTAPEHGVNVQFGPEKYKNVIRIHILNVEYKKFEITAAEMVVQMQDFNAPVQATGTRGGICLKDESVVRGTYDINVQSGPVRVEASLITADINVAVEDGPVTLRFGMQPENLYLNTRGCSSVVKLPDTWAVEYRIGNGEPKITIINTRGLTTVSVE